MNIEGNAETAQVMNLIPWMDYEFRVLASNILGIGEPSLPSSKIRTKEAGGCGDEPRSLSLPRMVPRDESSPGELPELRPPQDFPSFCPFLCQR